MRAGASGFPHLPRGAPLRYLRDIVTMGKWLSTYETHAGLLG